MSNSQLSDLLLWCMPGWYVQSVFFVVIHKDESDTGRVVRCTWVSEKSKSGQNDVPLVSAQPPEHCSALKRVWRKLLGKNRKLPLCHPLLKWAYHPLCPQICAYVGMPAYLRIWAELGVYIFSAWVWCNYTVKVPMGLQVLHLAPCHIPSFYCGFLPDRKTAVLSVYVDEGERSVSACVHENNH